MRVRVEVGVGVGVGVEAGVPTWRLSKTPTRVGTPRIEICQMLVRTRTSGLLHHTKPANSKPALWVHHIVLDHHCGDIESIRLVQHRLNARVSVGFSQLWMSVSRYSLIFLFAFGFSGPIFYGIESSLAVILVVTFLPGLFFSLINISTTSTTSFLLCVTHMSPLPS